MDMGLMSTMVAGVDFPLTDLRPFDRIVRLTYIYCF